MSDANLPDRIAEKLRRDILRGVLPPGASVKERDNAAEMGVSRTPMREAIRILAKEGLVVLRPSRSPVVAQHDTAETLDQIEVLIQLEKFATELACRNATKQQIKGLIDVSERMSEIYDNRDPIQMFEMDMGFHRAIAEASHNAVLIEIHTTLSQRLWRVRYLAAQKRRRREAIVYQHQHIARAINDGDSERAGRIVDLHLRGLSEHIGEVLAEERQTA